MSHQHQWLPGTSAINRIDPDGLLSHCPAWVSMRGCSILLWSDADVMPNPVIFEMPKNQDFIVFDGECVLCSGFFRFMVARDKSQRFQFATAQSPLGQAMYAELGLLTDDFETNLVVVDGAVYQRLDAFAAAMRALPGGWRVLSLCRYLPGFVKNPLYYAIARNRYKIFGRTAVCMVPDAGLRSRFLPEGF